MNHYRHTVAFCVFLVAIVLLGAGCSGERWTVEGPLPDTLQFAEFIEPEFPFITTTVNADTLASFVPARNWAVRGVVVQLGDSVHYAFDPDLLRMSLAWEGEFLTLVTMAMVSYHELQKENSHPRVIGRPIAGTGMYPGWFTEKPDFTDPRKPGLDPENPGKGPLPETYGRYLGFYLYDDAVVFSYEVGSARILEKPEIVATSAGPVAARTFEFSDGSVPMYLAAAEVPNATVASSEPAQVVLAHAQSDSVTVVRLDGDRNSGTLEVVDGRYIVARVDNRVRGLRIGMWTGLRSDVRTVESALAERSIGMPSDLTQGGSTRWKVDVRAASSPTADTSAFVYDDIRLPMPNPWERNVRPADIAFFDDGRAAIVTFDGDVWIVEDLHTDSALWKRFASGLFEPLALTVVDELIYVHGREGLIRLHDLNEDGEADFYEAFAPGIVHSIRSREWPFSVVARPEGGFFVSVGGALRSGSTRHLEALRPGFLGGSVHSGTVLKISPDGRNVEVFATGFRGPYIGIHPRMGALTASDQQGNFVPSTPIYPVHEGGYYGAPATAHRPEPLPEPVPPITWLPHQADPSNTSQIWALTDQLGPLNGEMLNISYGRPGFLRVYVDSAATPIQGGAVALPYPDSHPLLKAAVNPTDGLIYTVGFQVFGSRAARISGMLRMRYTGRTHDMPKEILAGRQGILLQFDEPIATPEPRFFAVRRWNYRRTGSYGSGHFRLDGSEGEERLAVAGVHQSNDGRNILLVVPDMQQVMQMQVDFAIKTEGGDSLSNTAYLTVNDVRELELERYGLETASWLADLQNPQETTPVESRPAEEPSAEKGRHLYDELGCGGCHSLDGSVEGNLGPTFAGLYGSQRPLESGDTVTADEDYLAESILDPTAQTARGFVDEQMPPYRGVLGPEDVQSIVLLIKSLRSSNDSKSKVGELSG